jgi:hypothetical protein
MLEHIISGAAFGAALTAAGVHRPSVIISQLNMTNFHMLEVFLAAAGGSTFILTLLRQWGYVHFGPRPFSSIGVFGPLDGNVVGAICQGLGMALSGACSGTVFLQTAAGIRSGVLTFSGAMLGGLLWSGFLRPAIERRSRVVEKPQPHSQPTEDELGLDKRLHLSREATSLVVEAVFVVIVGTVIHQSGAKTRGLLPPVTGGLLVAASQLLSVVLRKTCLGTSASYEEVGNYFWWLVSGFEAARTPQSYKNIIFAASMMLGCLAVVQGLPSPTWADEPRLHPLRVVLGGVLLSLGARLSGGCTSGHGISGIALLSLSSFLTIAIMFATGAAASMALT